MHPAFEIGVYREMRFDRHPHPHPISRSQEFWVVCFLGLGSCRLGDIGQCPGGCSDSELNSLTFLQLSSGPTESVLNKKESEGVVNYPELLSKSCSLDDKGSAQCSLQPSLDIPVNRRSARLWILPRRHGIPNSQVVSQSGAMSYDICDTSALKRIFILNNTPLV